MKGGSCDNGSDDQTITDDEIPQFDGGSDFESKQPVVVKDIFSINCEIDEVTHLVNFLRNCDFLWKSMKSHDLCIFNQNDHSGNCFFCNMRSSCLKLNVPRSKGPKGLKLFEFTSQFSQYDKLGWNWRENCQDLVSFLGNTLRLLRRSEGKVSSYIGFPAAYCNLCQTKVALKSKYVYQVKTNIKSCSSTKYTIKEVLRELMRSNGKDGCCLEFLTFENPSKRFLILEFTNPKCHC